MCLARCFFHELEACVSHGASLRCLAHVAHAKSDASGPRPGPMSLFVSLMTCSLGKSTKLDLVEPDTNYMLGQEQVPQPSEPQVPACQCQHLQTHAAKMHRSARNFSIKLQRYQASAKLGSLRSATLACGAATAVCSPTQAADCQLALSGDGLASMGVPQDWAQWD